MSLQSFLVPELSKGLVLRILLVGILAYAVFSQVLIPLRLDGHSMEPTYYNQELHFCWRGKYLFSEPQRGDIVFIRYAGREIMLLKRIIALPGETVAFHRGRLVIDGQYRDEPYLRGVSDWELSPRRVKEGHYYMAGDNRLVPIQTHDIGQVSRERIMGGMI